MSDTGDVSLAYTGTLVVCDNSETFTNKNGDELPKPSIEAKDGHANKWSRYGYPEMAKVGLQLVGDSAPLYRPRTKHIGFPKGIC